MQFNIFLSREFQFSKIEMFCLKIKILSQIENHQVNGQHDALFEKSNQFNFLRLLMILLVFYLIKKKLQREIIVNKADTDDFLEHQICFKYEC